MVALALSTIRRKTTRAFCFWWSLLFHFTPKSSVIFVRLLPQPSFGLFSKIHPLQRKALIIALLQGQEVVGVAGAAAIVKSLTCFLHHVPEIPSFPGCSEVMLEIFRFWHSVHVGQQGLEQQFWACHFQEFPFWDKICLHLGICRSGIHTLSLKENISGPALTGACLRWGKAVRSTFTGSKAFSC